MGHDPKHHDQRQTELAKVREKHAGLSDYDVTKARSDEAIEKRAAAREKEVAQLHREKGHVILAEGDENVKTYLNIPKDKPACDILAYDEKTRTLHMSEVKGSDLDKAMKQCDNTAKYAHQKMPGDVKFQPEIWLDRQHPQAKSAAIAGGTGSYSVKPQGNQDGPWMLCEKQGEKDRFAELPSAARNANDREVKPIRVNFGPDTEKGRQTRIDDKAKMRSRTAEDSRTLGKENEQPGRSK